jgi:2-polyprenyl-3-methyl-5-hydroxy-6-metoxy-1,4-benzoquinol methylase
MPRPSTCCACAHRPLVNLGLTPEGLLFQCTNCGTLRLEPRSSAKDRDDRAYGAGYRAGLDPHKSTRLYQLFRQCIPEPPTPGARLLDCGCGEGTFLARAQRDGWDAIGFDTDTEAVTLARQRGVPALVADAGRMPDLPGAFDVVTLWDVIEHIPDPARTVAALRSVLRSGGKVLTLTPNADSSLDALAQAERRLTHNLSQHLISLCVNRYHLHRFSRRGLVILFRRHGFVTERLTTLQLLSLEPGRYLSGFAPGIRGWTGHPALDRLLSRFAYSLLRCSGVPNKTLYVGTYVGHNAVVTCQGKPAPA